MPYRDPQKKLDKMKEWRETKIKEGYGKALYARRAQRFRNEEILRAAVERALGILTDIHRHNDEKVVEAEFHLREQLEKAPPIGKPLDYM